MNDAELESRLLSLLGRMSIRGDSRIGVSGGFPSFTVFWKDAGPAMPVSAPIPGGSPSQNLFQLIKQDNSHIRVTLSTIDGTIPTGFSSTDDPPFILAVSGRGVVYAHIVYSTSTGDISAWTIEKAASMPSPDTTNTYCQLGTYSTSGGVLSCLNTGYGPVNSTACQDWFSEGNPFSRSLTASAGAQTSGFTGSGSFPNLNIVNGLIIDAS